MCSTLAGLITISTCIMIATCQSTSSGVKGQNVVVDLSHWNPNVDFAKAKADGIRGVMHKATQGTGYVDKDYAPRKIQALKEGILWGTYHFGDGSPGADQANHFLKVVGEDPDTLLALDIEENSSQITLEIAEDFVKTVYLARGRYPLVYGAYLLKTMVKGKDTILRKCPLWVAQWSTNVTLPEGTWSDWTMWQYTDGKAGPTPHSVNGIGNCDRDTINTALHPDVAILWSSAGYPASDIGTTPVPPTVGASTNEPTTGTSYRTTRRPEASYATPPSKN